MIPTELDLEPEPNSELRLTLADDIGQPATEPLPTAPPLTAVLPSDFKLATLLSFLPNIKLKQKADAAAAEALAVDVTHDGGIALADERLAAVRAAVKEIEDCFDYPCRLAFDLHRRLTGLRADFSSTAKSALETVGRRVVHEQRRKDAAAAEARRKEQEEADRAAREAARRAAEEAERTKAPVAVVDQLRQRAQVATAPPVPAPVVDAPRKSTVVAKWKCRFKGTPEDAEPNPAVTELTPEQQMQFRALCVAVGTGKADLAALNINWSYLNTRAAADKTTFSLPELEAFDEGALRSRGRR